MAGFVMGVGLWTTTSRSGWYGVLAGCLVLALLAVPRRFVLPVVGASAAVMLVALEGIHLLLNTLNGDPAELRLGLWRDGLHMVAARPITGWGPDTTGLGFGNFLSQDYATLVTFDRIHSGPLDIAATQGVVGLAALGWVLVVLAIGAWRHRFAVNVAGLAAGLAGYTVWVAFNFDWAPATGMFWLLAGTLWNSMRDTLPPSGGRARERGERRTIRSIAAIAMVLAAVPLAALPLLADAWYLHGRADLSIAADPLQAQYHWALGEGFFARGDTELGLAELRRAAGLGETEPGMYVELGDHEAQLGDSAQARADYRRALQIDPYYSPAADRLRALGG
jgi:hypothetical protein